ncbi:tRNA pseudouridine synthase [Heracleum sosnowskyi]|uniref:tRNA pseudouridine synthase n=1 Tax=Heracleum sosnowskyi TaxID=360622 RepID=A0AAD8MIR0_9APIA|nr:tRNA pseudouridine synthase [Heracleum sosnowskyi]
MAESQSQSFSSLNIQNSLDLSPESPNRPAKVAKLVGDDEEDSELIEIDEAMNRKPGIQRYLLAVEYIGTRFCGAQQQPTDRTVVGVLQEAFRRFIGQSVSVTCSSRTDAGVHALSNVFHVDVERISKRKPGEPLPPHEPGVVIKAVNHFLQKNEGDITVLDVRCVSSDFHARYRAQERTYFYRLLSGPQFVSTFEKDRAWHVPEALDLSAMQRACKILAGHHDFSSFRSAACQAKSPIRTLDELSVTEVVSAPYFPSVMQREDNLVNSFECSESKTSIAYFSSAPEQNKTEDSNSESTQGFGMRRKHRCFVVTARSRSFLYHQVRLLVGTLKSVGTGDLTIPDVERILKAKAVTAASPMAPACGLYLAHVKYDLP